MIKFCSTYKEGTNKGIINDIRVQGEKKKYFIEEIMVESKHKVTNTHMGKRILSNMAKAQIYLKNLYLTKKLEGESLKSFYTPKGQISTNLKTRFSPKSCFLPYILVSC